MFLLLKISSEVELRPLNAVEVRKTFDSRRINLKRVCNLAWVFFREDKVAVHKQSATELAGARLSQVLRRHTSKKLSCV